MKLTLTSGQMQLINDYETYGRGVLQIYNLKEDAWGSVNSVGFDFREASVACRSMGCVKILQKMLHKNVTYKYQEKMLRKMIRKM